jgi:hypothetical protein
MKKDYRFWLIYGAAWLPYAASYTAVFITYQGSNYASAIKDALYNVLPAALLGVGVITLCRHFAWSRRQRIAFVAAHLLLSLAYAALWVSAVPLFYGVEGAAARGRWSYQPFTGYAFQWQFFAGLMLYGTIAGITYALQAAARLRAEEARAARAEGLRTHAEPALLQPTGTEPLARLFVRDARGRVVQLRADDVSRLVAADDYVTVHANKSSYLVGLSLNEFERRLDPRKFRRVHRSAIINLDHVVSCESLDRRLLLKLSDGSEVFASRAGSQLLREMFV